MRAAARPGNGWRCVEDDDEFAPPHQFNVRSTGPRELPPRNTALIEYFLLLFTAATMRVVLQ